MTRDKLANDCHGAMHKRFRRARWCGPRLRWLIERAIDRMPVWHGNASKRAHAEYCATYMGPLLKSDLKGEYGAIWVTILVSLLPYVIEFLIEWWSSDMKANSETLKGWQAPQTKG